MISRRGVLAAALAAPLAARAQERAEPDPRLAAAADTFALAYVVTGDADLDATSEAGLSGLGQQLTLRTTVEPGPPVAVDLERDDLTLLSLLYWPVGDAQPAPSPQAYLRLNAFLRTGGMIVFDTRDGDIAGLGAPDAQPALQALAAPLEIPPLAPIPEDHVLTRAFYLLRDFPGRTVGAPVWVEAPADTAAAAEGGFRNLNDNVSPVVIGGNDWAAAWAVDADGLPLHAVGRGWEGEEQREMAYRFGINLAMYVLTGNYKSDQIHVQDILERLKWEAEQP